MAGADQTALAAQGAANAAALGGQTAANLAQPLPGQAGLQTQASTDISSALQGQLPPDVVTLLDQEAAQRGVATGSPGGQNSTASLMQALGLTSLSQVSQGESALNAAISSNRVANPVAPVGIAPVGNPTPINPINYLPNPAQPQVQPTGNQGNIPNLFINPTNPGGVTGTATQPSTLYNPTPAAPTPAAPTPVAPTPADPNASGYYDVQGNWISGPNPGVPQGYGINSPVDQSGQYVGTQAQAQDPSNLYNPLGTGPTSVTDQMQQEQDQQDLQDQYNQYGGL
jgi:hypothetical protein